MLNDFIGVEQKSKSSKKQGGFLEMPEVADSLGIVKFVGNAYDGPIKVGDAIHYANERQQIRMQGMDIHVMKPDNIIAIVEEDNGESKN